MNIRAKIFGGGAEPTPLVGTKQPAGAKPDELASLPIARREARLSNNRGGDRHWLPDQPVSAVHRGKSSPVSLLNLSGGGAMITAPFAPKLWDRVDLKLGDKSAIECAVIWLKGDRVGLEFAHETRLECSADQQAAVLRDVISRSFPDLAFEGPVEPNAAADRADEDEQRGERRHPLIWSGQIHHNHATTPVRLRNISSSGALIECAATLRVGSEPLLDLGEAGTIFATVSWVAGDCAGLSFAQPFDLANLAQARPEVTPVKWERPSYLQAGAGSESPWAKQWGRMSLAELREDLEGFIKR